MSLSLGNLVFAVEKQADHYSEIDRIHNDWSERVLKTASRLDSFFSNSEARDTDQKTRVRVFVRTRYDGNEGIKLSPGIRVRLSLPSTEHRLKLIVGDEEDESRISDLDDSQQNISLQVRGGHQSIFKRLNFDLGIRRRNGKLQPYVRARHSKPLEIGTNLRPKVTNSFFYFTKSKFEYRGQFELDRKIGSDYLMRPSSVVRWYQDNPDECGDGFCLDQYFSLYEKLRHWRSEAIAYDLEIFLRSRPTLRLHDAVLKARYRRRTNEKWLFWEVEPGLHFPSEYDHDPTFRFTIRLEGIFGYRTTVDINENFIPATASWSKN